MCLYVFTSASIACTCMRVPVLEKDGSLATSPNILSDRNIKCSVMGAIVQGPTVVVDCCCCCCCFFFHPAKRNLSSVVVGRK